LIWYKILFRIKDYFDILITQSLRRIFYFCNGAKFGNSTRIPLLYINWPHQLSVGKNCILEDNLVFKYDSICKHGPNIVIGNDVFIGNNTEFNICHKIFIGNDTLIASNCKFIDHDHGLHEMNSLIRLQKPTVIPISIENNVWIGANCTILKGVSIGKGSVIGAGSLVNKDIPQNEIWGGVPAKLIKKRINLTLKND